MSKLQTPGPLVTLEKNFRTLSTAVVSAIAVAFLTLAAPAAAQKAVRPSTSAVKAVRRKPLIPDSSQVVIDPTNRIVTTDSFSVTWSTTNDTEAITSFIWNGGSNLTSDQGIGTCFPPFPGSVEYFGNSYAPPDPWAGGLVLVGGGTTTPPGTTAWSGQVLPNGTAQVIINSASTGCPPSSAGINVQTTYNFFNPDDPNTYWFGVQRSFDFTNTTFAYDFRPYMARLSLDEGFTEALYPDTSGALATVNVFDCGLGCTGPVVIPDATLLTPPWDSTQGWFAMHNPTTLQGVVVSRTPSNDPQGNPIVTQLWVDNDGGSGTNVTSFLLMYPGAGFTGGMVTEVETLCFYDSSTWTPSMTPPAACNNSALSPTTTALASSLNPSNYGQSVTFTATVTSSSGTPTGSVIFYDGSTQIGSATLANGSAAFSTSSLPTGSNSITAAYQGSSSFAPSTSAVLSQVVNGIATATSVASSQNPSTYGQSVTFTAMVTSGSGTPTGTVIFYDGTTAIGNATLASGSGSISSSSLPAGSNSITAAYQGSGAFEPSTSAVLTQVVNNIATTTSLGSSLNPSTYGQSVTFTAMVTSGSGTPTGTVIFYDGTTAIGNATLSSGSGSISTAGLPAGSNSITAAYQGSGAFAPSTSGVLIQAVALSNTTTALASSINPVKVGQRVTYTATVSPQYGGAVTGTVTFQDNGTTVATVGVSNDQAGFTTKYAAAGVQLMTAIYSGDSNDQGSTSAGLMENVGNALYATQTSVTTSGSPSLYGQPVTFTATVTSKNGPIPDGETVTFYADYKEIGMGTTSGGAATFTTSSLAAKTWNIKASYPGDSHFKKSDGTLAQVVTPISTTTTLTSSLNPSTYGQPVTWTATVTSNGGPVPTGKVTFHPTGGVVTLNSSGVATFSKTWLNAGTKAITAEYAGDDANAPSDSATLDQVVNQAATTTVVTSSPNPSSQGQSVTLTATLTASTGVTFGATVTFTAGGMTLGTATTSGNVASISTSALPVGSTVVQATFAGNLDFTGSSGMVTQTVNP